MKPLSISPTLLLLLAHNTHNYSAHAFSAAPASPSSDGIKIVGLPGGQVQSLPGMYVQSFRRWIVDDVDNGNNNNGTNIERSSSCTSLKMEPIEGAGLFGKDGEGWVDPTTTSELWWPADLPALQARPLLNALFLKGRLSYVSAGLDVRTPHSSSAGKNDDREREEVVSWRNYGLNSQPIARQWTTLDVAMERMFHVEGFVLRGGTGEEDEGDEESDQQPHHDALFPSLDTQGAMQRVATFIAELDSSTPIADGFHIASFPMMEGWTDLPSVGTKEDGGDDDGENDTYKIVCLGTSEPFATKLLDMDEDLLTMSSTSVLEVEVSRTAGGGDSQYLPEVYRGLYLNR